MIKRWYLAWLGTMLAVSYATLPTPAGAWDCDPPGSLSIDVAEVVAGQQNGNDFCFDSSQNGFLKIHFRATVSPECNAGNVVWSTSITGTTVEWDPSSTGTVVPEGHNEVWLKLTGLPSDNYYFGPRTVTVTSGNLSDTYNLRLFYPAFVKTHPGPYQGVTPNWYYYYMQTDANPGNVGYYDNIFYNRGGVTFWYAPGGPWVCMYDNGGNIPLNRPAWGSPAWIDVFAWYGRHELRHLGQFTGFWGDNDRDPDQDSEGDYLPDLSEPYTGRGYNPLTWYTYEDTIGYSAEPMIEDAEDLCMRVDDGAPFWPVIQLWQNGDATDEDWAKPGLNWQ